MIEIIPTIIAKNFQELEEKVRKVEPYVNWVQLDIMDGKFVENITWHEPAELKNLKTGLNLETHLMVEKPERVIDDWFVSGVKRIIIHYEATNQANEIIEKIRQANLETGMALNPKTSIDVLDVFLQGETSLDLVLIMTVQPGRGGQKFLGETLDKIRNLRKKYPALDIEVDGGINLEIAPQVVKAGANLLASGTAVLESENTEKIISQFKNLENK